MIIIAIIIITIIMFVYVIIIGYFIVIIIIIIVIVIIIYSFIAGTACTKPCEVTLTLWPLRMRSQAQWFHHSLHRLCPELTDSTARLESNGLPTIVAL